MEGSTLAAGRRVAPTAPLRVLGDEALVRLAARGSESAFSAIFDRHHQALYRYAMTIVGNREDAFDTVQNAFVSLLRSLPGEQREINLKPWLFRIVHNEAISLIRQRGTTSTELTEEPSMEESPEDRMLAQSIITDLSSLGVQQRSAVAMRELNGLSHAEIGEALGVSEAAAKQAVYEGRVALQQIAEGREMSCAEIQRSLSANDRRLTKGRRVRSHLKACPTCRAFQDSISERRVGLAAISPLPVALSAQLLSGIFGSGGGPAGGLMIGAGSTAGAGAAAQSFGVGTLAKVGISAALVVGGGVAIERGVDHAGDASAEGGAPSVAGKPADEGELTSERSNRVADRHGAEGQSSGGRHGVAGESATGGRGGRGERRRRQRPARLRGRGPEGRAQRRARSPGPEGQRDRQRRRRFRLGGGSDGGGDPATPAPTTPAKDTPPNGNGPAHGQAIADSHDPGVPRQQRRPLAEAG